MSNNRTCYLSKPPHFGDEAKFDGFALYVVNMSVLIPVAVLSPVAVMANALVLAAIWKNVSLRTPSYILLACLAFTDFCTGLISQPFFVANQLICMVHPAFEVYENKSWPTFYLSTKAIGESFAIYFFQVTVSVITLMSIERWLLMSRRSLLTVRRVCYIVGILLLLMVPSTVLHYRHETQFTVFLLVLVCIIATSVAYFNVFRIIRRHQQQIQVNTFSQNLAQPAINFAKYKKSVWSILYIIVIFYMAYLPVLIPLVLSSFVLTNPDLEFLLFNVSGLLVFLSSSLNPLIFLCRMSDVRNEVIQLLKRLFCKNN